MAANAKNKPPIRRPNIEARPGGEYLTDGQVQELRQAAASVGRYGARDSLMILMAYVHGLRAAELVGLLFWEQLNLKNQTVYIRRVKGSVDGTHKLTKEEVKLLGKMEGERKGPVFLTERGGAFTTSTFGKIVARAGREANFPMLIHPHMLRHSCGYNLANNGRDIRLIQDWLGHKNIQNTVGYTALSADRFVNFWPGG
jgi:integrase